MWQNRRWISGLSFSKAGKSQFLWFQQFVSRLVKVGRGRVGRAALAHLISLSGGALVWHEDISLRDTQTRMISDWYPRSGLVITIVMLQITQLKIASNPFAKGFRDCDPEDWWVFTVKQNCNNQFLRISNVVWTVSFCQILGYLFEIWFVPEQLVSSQSGLILLTAAANIYWWCHATLNMTNCPLSHHHNDKTFVAVLEVSSRSRLVSLSSQPWTLLVTLVMVPRGERSQTQVTRAATVLTTNNMTSSNNRTNINTKVGSDTFGNHIERETRNYFLCETKILSWMTPHGEMFQHKTWFYQQSSQLRADQCHIEYKHLWFMDKININWERNY